MVEFFGWVLVAAAVALVITAARRRGRAPAAGLSPKVLVAGAAVSLILGGYLALSGRLALAHMHTVDMSHPDDWAIGGEANAFKWDGGRITGKLVVEADTYAAFPVDWHADAFRADWDITITRLDLRPEWGERASIGMGLADGSEVNIDDPDHVSGSALEACFSDDVRLRASDADHLLKTHSSTELTRSSQSTQTFTPSPPVHLELNTPYHCTLTYYGPDNTATLSVTQNGRRVASRRLEDLREFTPSVSWFVITVRGFKHRNKQVEVKLGKAYTKPEADLVVENLRYEQP